MSSYCTLVSNGNRLSCGTEFVTHQSVLSALDVGDVHVVGRGAEILELLASEDVNGDKVDLGVTVLAGLGGRHVDDLARAVLDHDETVLPQSRALHGVGERGTGITTGVVLEVMVLSEPSSQYWNIKN